MVLRKYACNNCGELMDGRKKSTKEHPFCSEWCELSYEYYDMKNPYV